MGATGRARVAAGKAPRRRRLLDGARSMKRQGLSGWQSEGQSAVGRRRPMSTGGGGAAPAAGTAKGILSPVRASSETQSPYRENTKHRGSSNPVNPLVKPLSLPRIPARTRKPRAHAPRFAGPAPTASSWDPDAPGQYPGGSRSENDPCPGLRYLRTGGACGFFIIQYMCDKVNTLVGDPGGFFCHSVIQESGGRFPAWDCGCRRPPFMPGARRAAPPPGPTPPPRPGVQTPDR